MNDRISGVIGTVEDRPRESFDAPTRGDASWFTLFSGDLTPTEQMSVGIMELEPGGVGLKPHRHKQPEIYYVVSGSGIVTIAGNGSPVKAGTAAFIAGDAEHSLRNTGDVVLRVFYVFPTDRFSDVIYRFPEGP